MDEEVPMQAYFWIREPLENLINGSWQVLGTAYDCLLKIEWVSAYAGIVLDWRAPGDLEKNGGPRQVLGSAYDLWQKSGWESAYVGIFKDWRVPRKFNQRPPANSLEK